LGIRRADHATHSNRAKFVTTSTVAAVAQSVYFACGLKANEFVCLLSLASHSTGCFTVIIIIIIRAWYKQKQTV
jgi:hypothetical protein